MPSPNVAQLLAHPAVRAAITRALAARGVHGDTELIHADPREEAMLRMMGGVGTVNPKTGLRQFYDAKGATGGSASTGENDTGMGSNPGGYGRASDGGLGGVLSDIGGFIDRAAGNFGSGWGSRGVAGGYGNASTGASSDGSGAGYGGGHSGQNYYSQTYGGLPPPAGQIPSAPPLPAAPVINNLPGPPVALTPMMSSTATTDLAGGERFGALPSWATQPYQVGMAPSSYPTPGVNAGLGAPGYAGNPLPGQPGGGGGILGGGGGAPGGGSAPGGGGAPSGPVAGPYVGLANLAASGPAGQKLANLIAPPPGSPQDYWAQMLASGQVKPSPALQAFYAATGGGLGAQQPPPIAGGSPRNTGAIAGPAASAPAAAGIFQRAAQQQGQPQIHPAVAQALAQVAAPRPALPGPALGQVAAKPFANLAAKPPVLTAAQKAAAARLAASKTAARTGGKNFG